METKYTLQHQGDESRQLRIAHRSEDAWTFQAVLADKAYANHKGDDVSVYYFVEDFEDMLPDDVFEITNLRDWVHVLENLPEGVVVTDEADEGVTAAGLVEQLRDVLSSNGGGESGPSEGSVMHLLLQSVTDDVVTDVEGNVFSLRRLP